MNWIFKSLQKVRTIFLTIYSFLIHEHGTSFHWFVSFIFLAMFYSLQCTGLLLPWLRLFWSILLFIMLLYKKVFSQFTFQIIVSVPTCKWFLLIFYDANLLNLFLTIFCFVVESLEFYTHKIMSALIYFFLSDFGVFCLSFWPNSSG